MNVNVPFNFLSGFSCGFSSYFCVCVSHFNSILLNDQLIATFNPLCLLLFVFVDIVCFRLYTLGYSFYLCVDMLMDSLILFAFVDKLVDSVVIRVCVSKFNFILVLNDQLIATFNPLFVIICFRCTILPFFYLSELSMESRRSLLEQGEKIKLVDVRRILHRTRVSYLCLRFSNRTRGVSGRRPGGCAEQLAAISIGIFAACAVIN